MQGPKAGASVAQAEHNPTAAIMEQPMLDPHSNGIGPDFDFCRKYVRFSMNFNFSKALFPGSFVGNSCSVASAPRFCCAS